MIRRTPPPDEPWCLAAMGANRIIHIPESRAEMYIRYGWRVIAKDSECPMPEDLPLGQVWDYRPRKRQPQSGENCED